MTVSWFAIRGSGIAAYALLSTATIWGLLVSTKVLGQAVRAKGLTWFHESLGLAAVVATGVHLVALSLDEYVQFGPRELFLPGASGWRPLAVALGITAFYGMVVVALSFYVKQWIGQGWWRSIHYLGFGAFLAATAHGVLAGTDTSSPPLFATYTAASVTVLVLLVIRIAQVSSDARQSSRAGRSVRSAPAQEEPTVRVAGG